VEVTAIDISPAMLARLVARGAGRVAAARMDAARLGFRHSSFDCVLLHLAIAVVPDPAATMHEVARVLRPGGRISVFDKSLPDDAVASPMRRAAGALASLVATNLNRQLGPLLVAGELTLRERESVGVGGLFIAARADKAALSSTGSRFAL
jgi:ubiquinone/menaquinone biosynthesis C-methylase UbiE